MEDDMAEKYRYICQDCATEFSISTGTENPCICPACGTANHDYQPCCDEYPLGFENGMARVRIEEYARCERCGDETPHTSREECHVA